MDTLVFTRPYGPANALVGIYIYKMQKQNNSVKSLAPAKRNCKYQIVFMPKYRRKVFYEEKRAEIKEIIRTLCSWKEVEIMERAVCHDYIQKNI